MLVVVVTGQYFNRSKKSIAFGATEVDCFRRRRRPYSGFYFGRTFFWLIVEVK